MPITRSEGPQIKPNVQGMAKPLHPDANSGLANSVIQNSAQLEKTAMKLAMLEKQMKDAENQSYAGWAKAGADQDIANQEQELARTMDTSNPAYKHKLDEVSREIFKSFIDAAPNKEVKKTLSDHFTSEHGRLMVRAGKLEFEKRLGNTALTLKKTLDILNNSVETRPYEKDRTTKEGLDLIKNNGVLDFNQKEKLSQGFISNQRYYHSMGRIEKDLSALRTEFYRGDFDEELERDTKDQLKSKIDQASGKLLKFDQIEHDLANGIPLKINNSQDTINAYYQKMEQDTFRDNDYQPVTVEQSTRNQALLGEPAAPYHYMMKDRVLNKSPEDAAPYLTAYKTLQMNAPQTLDNLDKKTVEVLDAALDQLEMMPVNDKNAAEAIKKGRAIAMPADKNFSEERKNWFDSKDRNPGWSPDRARNTTAKMFGIKESQVPWGLTEEARRRVRQMMMSQQGVDLAGANRTVARQMRSVTGKTKVMGNPEQFVRYPMEKTVDKGTFKEGYWLKNMFEFDMAEFSRQSMANPDNPYKYPLTHHRKVPNSEGFIGKHLPYDASEHKKGSIIPNPADPNILIKDHNPDGFYLTVDNQPRKVLAIADDITMSAPRESKTWALVWRDDNGIETPFFNPDGSPARYQPHSFGKVMDRLGISSRLNEDPRGEQHHGVIQKPRERLHHPAATYKGFDIMPPVKKKAPQNPPKPERQTASSASEAQALDDKKKRALEILRQGNKALQNKITEDMTTQDVGP